TFLSTPAARSCSSSTEGGTFSSLANWATLDWATLCGLLAQGALLRRLAFEPMRPRGHDELLRLLLVQAGHFGELVDGEVGEIVARLHALLRELGGKRRVHALELQQLRIHAFHRLFVRDR